MSWVSLAVASASATVGGYRYFRGKSQAKKNIRPPYNIDPQYEENIDILTNTMGLPQSALELYYKNIGQNTNQGINVILGAGGNGNQIASLVGNRNQNYQQIALMDALQKKQDINSIINARQMLADQRDKSFSLNKFNPYKDRSQAYAAEQAAGFAQIGGALNSASAAIANNKTSKLADSIGSQGINITPTAQPTTPNSGVNTNYLFQQFQQMQPNLNFGQPNNQFNFQQPQGLPFAPSYPQQQPQIQPQWTPQSLQAPQLTPGISYQDAAPYGNSYGNTGLDYQAWFNFMMNNRYQ